MNAEYDIKSPSGVSLYKGILNSNCVRKFSLMSEDSITLCFSSSEAINFPIGSYVGDFYITKQQVGTWNAATGVWDYQLKFDAYYWTWQNKILRYVIQGIDSAKETSFTLTADIEKHINVILNCMEKLGITYGDTLFRPETDDTVSKEAKLIQYENLSILGGIQAIAEAFDCEWWVKDNAICFGRCEAKPAEDTEEAKAEFEANIPVFKAGDNVSSISFQEAKSEAPNRLYIYGSDRNLPPNYRKVDGNDTIGGVVVRRLMLPPADARDKDGNPYPNNGNPYLQTSESLTEAEIVEKVVIFSDVYPKTDLTISDIEVYTNNGTDDEGNDTTESFYRLKYGDSFFFSESYILPDEELHIVFTSGKLNGMDFGARFNPKGLNEKNADDSWNPDAQMIEIVANEDYGRKLPDDILKPEVGDKPDTFILYGWDSTKMEELGLIADAEAQLLEEGQKALEEYTKDLSNCTCPMAWDYMKPLFEAHKQPMPGDAVTIIDTAHFGKGGRRSRIIGYEYKLDKPYAECTYTCGESVSVSRLKSLETKVEGLAKTGQKVQLQNSLDFLSKRYADRTPYALNVGGTLTAEAGMRFGASFAEGLTGFGGKIDEYGNGWMESLSLRRFLEVPELRCNRVEVQIGNKWNAPGGGIVEKCVPDLDPDGVPLMTGTVYLHLEDGEIGTIKEDDICMGIFHDGYTSSNNATADYDDSIGNFRFAGFYTAYFRITEVIETGRNSVFRYALRAVSARWSHKFHPCEAMHFVGYGNFTDKERQRSRYSTRSYERYLKDVADWEFTENNIAAQFGDLSNLSVFGLRMAGYSAYLNNIYMTGVIEQIRNAPVVMEIDTDGDSFLAYGEELSVTCRVKRGWEDVTSKVTAWGVTRDSGDAADDTAWLLKPKVRDFAGSLTISFTSTENDLGNNPNSISTLFTFTATLAGGTETVTHQMII